MTLLALIRHGPTDWNGEGRLQGRTDRPLSEDGRALVRSWSLPPSFAGFDWISSPLGRAMETASLLAGAIVPIDARLIEMAYGDWEGERLADLRMTLGQEMADNEARGLDFQPPGGESPRMVMERLRGFWRDIGQAGRSTVAVCHNGVIRASYAAATAWDMKSKPPAKLKNGHAHLFEITENGTIDVVDLNMPLTEKTS